MPTSQVIFPIGDGLNKLKYLSHGIFCINTCFLKNSEESLHELRQINP